ncbi:protein L7/L12 [Seminavis robusta]|uniref:Protein L7/L12 n=1 Tax=Seminavis robusta TaxID=568900 RepID=A0A9N8D9N2_9STRA|nr:protein L7/L12 [Seminavis robusta]|eukprot:Sro25_g017240.1 protein L7/L12 (222) ;mRNA; f:137943-138608
MTLSSLGRSASISVRTVCGSLGTRRLSHHLSALSGSQLASKPTIQRPSVSHTNTRDVRRFASASEAAAKKDEAATPSPEELTFSTPRVKELYERMIQLERDQVSLVGELVLETLNMPVEEDEFYYHGIGKSGGRGGAGAAAPVEVVEVVKKDKFDLKLAGFDDKSKIKVIKEVRTLTGLGLKEAKELVESAPKVIQKDLKTEQAEELKEKLEAVGAQIELV